MIVSIEKDPFRFFFPLGVLFAFVGILPWSSQLFGLSGYPAEFHKVIMMNGFMLSFVIGFLMTAVPRFTSARYATIFEVSGVGLFLLGAAVFEFLDFKMAHHLFSSIALLLLITFSFRRFVKRKSNPPFTFLFVGVGLALWTLSNLMHFWMLLREGARPSSSHIWGDLFSNGALMSIVLGVGGRLIPGILGRQEIVAIQRERYEKPVPFIKVVPPVLWLLVIIYLCSFFLKPILPAFVVLSMRAVVVTSFAFTYWKIHKLPKERSYLTWGIWASCWCFMLGALLNVFWYDMYAHGLHMILIGGFSLLTVLIATRVTLAHGTDGRAAEKTSRFIPIFATLIVVAMLTRVTAPLFPQTYLNHLNYATLVWAIGFTFWSVFLIPKMMVFKS